jgi:hypothetical protein
MPRWRWRGACSDAKKRFVKRGEVEKLQHELEQKAKREKELERQRREDEERGVSRKVEEESTPVAVDIPLPEVIKRLRRLRSPITSVTPSLPPSLPPHHLSHSLSSIIFSLSVSLSLSLSLTRGVSSLIYRCYAFVYC